MLPERYAHSVAALGYPGSRRAFQVGSGSVVAGGDAALEWRLPGPDSVRVSPVYFERDGVPVAHWWMASASESVHFEAAAMPTPFLGDSSLLLSVRATATRTAPGPGEVALDVVVRGRPDGPFAPPWDVGDAAEFDEYWVGVGALRNGLLVAGVDPDAGRDPGAPDAARPARTRGFGPGALVARCRAALAPGERRAWHFWMPVYPCAPALGRKLERESRHERMAALARTAWRDWLAHAARLETADSLVNAAWRAALVTLVQSHERDGQDWIPIGNPFQYRDVWLRDGARVVRALAVAGLPDLARADAWALRRFQLPPGAFLSQRGQLDGTGQALWAFEQAGAIPPDSAFARRVLPYAARGLGWIQRQRDLSRVLQVPWAGLLPYGDPRDNELVRAQLVGNDAWGLAGARAVARLAVRAGDDPLARDAGAAYQDYRRSFLEALARARHPDLPASWQGVGRDWGNLSVGYPTAALPPGDPRLAAAAERVWRRRGGPGLVTYGPEDSLHTYLGTDLAQWALLAGRPRAARALLASLIAHSSSTLGQAEIFARSDGGFGQNLPPHGTAAATLVDLVRNMLVCDESDTLELALGGDPAWWEGTRFERAPTRFGAVDLTLERSAPDRLRARWRGLSPGVPVRVRVPDDVKVLEAAPAGTRLTTDGFAIPPAGATEVELRLAAPGRP